MGKIDEKILEIASCLQDNGYLVSDNGLSIQDIAETTGMAKSTVYRLIDLPQAKRWGISRTSKRKQPYTYYVDNETLIQYQMYFRTVQAEQTPAKIALARRFDNKEQQALYEMLNSFVVEAVGQIKHAKGVHERFVENTKKSTNDLVMILMSNKADQEQKLLAAFLLMYQNLEV